MNIVEVIELITELSVRISSLYTITVEETFHDIWGVVSSKCWREIEKYKENRDSHYGTIIYQSQSHLQFKFLLAKISKFTKVSYMKKVRIEGHWEIGKFLGWAKEPNSYLLKIARFLNEIHNLI